MRRFLHAILALVTVSSGAVAMHGQIILVHAVPNESYATEVQAKLAATGLLGGPITLFNAQLGTPSLELLAQNKGVLVFSDSSFFDAVALGNVLADYVDQGGGVVQAAFTTFSSWAIGGDWDTANYNPVVTTTYAPGGATLGVVHETGHPIMTGISNLNGGTSGYYAGSLTTRNGMLRIADWSDGSVLVAVNPNFPGRVAAVNLYPPSTDALGGSWPSNTQGALLLANAVNFVAVPEPSTWALFGIGTLWLVVIGLRRRR